MLNQNEIIEMARQAGAVPIGFNKTTMQKEYSIFFNELEAFAKLVAAAAASKEREACAKVCYELPWKDMTQIPSNLAFAAAIRARGEA